MPKNGGENGLAVENRWWVDTGRAKDSERKQAGEKPAAGSNLFAVAQGFDQEMARARLTNSAVQLFEEAHPAAGEWRVVRTLANERFPAADLERMKGRLRLPPGARGVIVDAGRSARFIVTGDPIGERVLEFTLGEESSFDCWICGDWVYEQVFGSVSEAMRKARPYLERFLVSQPGLW